ncbi:MAG: methionine--tRNA ligase [Alphaproteobacteria bacterium]|nr:methionine--tRNA ligase [Alphaproteobacteria bacterium]
MTGRTPFYITTPIYYVNDRPHIGHAYTTLACDVLARFKRLDGYDVKFLTGTDEHGQKVEKSAAVAGLPPQVFTDQVSQNFRDLARAMNFSNDDFIRTTESRHTRSCQALWQELVQRDQIYLGGYKGWYAVRDEAFYAESELVIGQGGQRLAPTGAPVEWVEEPSYFFRLSAWQEPLLRLYETRPDFIAPDSRRNEVMSFVKSGLQDLSVSRTTFKWGVPVPGDSEHIMYVWLDALTNYITAVGYPDQSGAYASHWPADLHMVGKDIVRFHAVFWPAFLMAAGLEPPKRVYAHGWWTNEGEKISKSVGNVIDPLALIARYGLDPVRYFLMREVPFGNDGDYSHRAMVNRVNGELANDLGNLAQRVLSMIDKNCAGRLPQPGSFLDDDRALMQAAYDLLPRIRWLMDRQVFHEALETIWSVVRAANGYVDRQAPWALKKNDPPRMETVLYVLAETIRVLGLLMQPFVPDSASKMLDQLAIAATARDFTCVSSDYALRPDQPLPKPQGIFPRYVEAVGEGDEGAQGGR